MRRTVKTRNYCLKYQNYIICQLVPLHIYGIYNVIYYTLKHLITSIFKCTDIRHVVILFYYCFEFIYNISFPYVSVCVCIRLYHISWSMEAETLRRK